VCCIAEKQILEVFSQQVIRYVCYCDQYSILYTVIAKNCLTTLFTFRIPET